jgi:6-pyruvoyltetrahydropterin/6-carboxytetrahydropterin synthase
VAVEVTGPLDENQYVIDFIALRDELKKLTDELDHRVLLPTSHPLIQVEANDTEVQAVFTPDGRRWLFPRGDCILLPVSNTTAELLANWLGHRLLTALEERLGTTPSRLQVAVDENHGQWGVWEWPE